MGNIDDLAGGCVHLREIHEVTPRTEGCEDCLRIGDTWVHLRLCESCGHVGCCDDSKNKHATRHFHTTHHPIIKSFEPGEDWGWCFVDEAFFRDTTGKRGQLSPLRTLNGDNLN